MSSNINNLMRITGFSGFDVDSTVKQLMQAENARVDKIKQQRQITQWTQDLYRGVIGDINTFKSNYFDVLKSDTYILSSKNYSTFDVKSSDTSNKITATASAGTVAGNYSITVNQVAKAAGLTGSTVNVDQAANGISFPVVMDNSNNEFNIAIGAGYKVTLDNTKTYNSLSDMAADLNSKMGSISLNTSDKTTLSQNLSDKVTAVVSSDGKSIQFQNKIEITDSNKNITLNMNGTSFDVTLTSGNLSMNDIVSQINSKVSSLSGFPSGVTAQSTDGQVISFKNSDGTPYTGGSVVYKDTQNTVSAASITVTGNSNQTIAGGGTSTKLTFSTNQFTYDKQIITGKNDSLYFDVINSDGTKNRLTVNLDQMDYGNTDDADILGDPTQANTLLGQIKTKLDAQLTTNNLNAGDIQVRKALDGSGELQLVSKLSNQIMVSGSGTNTLGFSSSFELSQSNNDKITDLLTGQVDFKINDVELKYDFTKSANDKTLASGYIGAKDMSISSIMGDIQSKVNINIGYSELTKQFTITTRDTGATQAITAQDLSGSFLNTIFGGGPNNTTTGKYDSNASTGNGISAAQAGQDAQVVIKEPNDTGNSTGTTVNKSTNTFTIDGVNYNIDPTLDTSGTTKPSTTLTVTQNVDSALTKIKDFISKYNDLIGKLNSKLDEKRDYSYIPLTDDEKKSLNDNGEASKITELEDKAKQGLLKNDSIISNMVSSLRMAFYDTVTGAGINLPDIGLSTSDDTTQRGKIVIDEDKLKDALKNNGDKIVKLFTQQSTSAPYYYNDLSASDRTKRYNEEGIFQRINDILQDNVRMTRDNSGNKGFLIQKAGIQGDITDVTSLLSQELKDKDDTINSMEDKLSEKQTMYYNQFNAMEQALTQMNAQSQWIASQLGAG